MLELMTKLLERLVKLFSGTGHQSRLEAYIASRRPVDVFDVERFQREFGRGFI